MDLKQSYRHGASSAPLIGQTIGSFLSTISEKHGDREALVVPFQNVRMTYRELYRDAERFAAGLKKMGLQPGDRIAILSQNNAEWVIAQFGTAIAGLILITVNPSYRLSELEHVLSKSGCRAIIATPSLKTTNFLEMLECLAPQLFNQDSNEESSRLPSLEFLIVIGGDQCRNRVGIPFHDVARTANDEDLISFESSATIFSLMTRSMFSLRAERPACRKEPRLHIMEY
jgi:fatty-acyl-CoA synthase